MIQAITNIDFQILDFIRAHLKCAFLDAFMPFISYLGNGGMIWLIAGALLLLTKQYRKHGLMVLTGLLVGFLLGNLILKPLIARPRPCWINESVSLPIRCPKDFSFPSGHTLSSFIAAFLLTKTNRNFGYFAIPVACLMAFSRLYLYVHFPSDILGAILLALAISKIVYILFSKRFFKK